MTTINPFQYRHDKALRDAAHEGSLPQVEVALRLGANPLSASLEGMTALHHAAWYGSVDCTQVLLPLSDVTAVEAQDGLTPLHCAAEKGHAEVLALLLPTCDPLTKAYQGRTALHLAARCGHTVCCRLLLEVTPPDILDEIGCSPLMLATYKDHADCVALLLTHSPLLSQTDFKFGRTALHWAARFGSMNALTLLLPLIPPDLLDANGLTPRHLAHNYGHYDCADTIEAFCRALAEADVIHQAVSQSACQSPSVPRL